MARVMSISRDAPAVAIPNDGPGNYFGYNFEDYDHPGILENDVVENMSSEGDEDDNTTAPSDRVPVVR